MTIHSILLYGCGNMGGAMLAGWIAGGLAPERFTIVDPFLAEAPAGVTLLREAPAGPFDAVLLGVKPQMLGAILPALEPLCGPETLVLSILAGVELSTLSERLPRAMGRVRIMPNLAAALGKSPIALGAEGLGPALQQEITALMQPLGQPEWIAEEQFDLVTALAGSGPAFVYRFIDALAAGATELGLDPVQAERLALSMVEGASALAAQSEHSPGELARRVASPGGVTQVGIDILDADQALARLMARTLAGARDRSAEMAAEARKRD